MGNNYQAVIGIPHVAGNHRARELRGSPEMFRSALSASRSATVFAGDITAGLAMKPFS